MGTARIVRTTRKSEPVTATRTTRPFAQTFASAISKAAERHDQHVLDRPVLALADHAAPVKIIVSVVTWLMMATMLVNQDVSPFGL